MLGKQLAEGRQKETYTRRAKSLKWILVTCFGYTGYKNARFGKIEAHESINAFARAGLLHAKEIVEAHGFEVLHLLVDSLWIKKPNARDDEYPSLMAEIAERTGLPIALEGVYNWVAFLPSKQHSKIGVPNRYFGVFRNGEIKTRGIELRRRDTAPWIKQAQQQAIEILARARNHRELMEQTPQVIALVRDQLEMLRSGRVDYRDLVLTYHLSRDPKEYRHNTLNAVVARDLMQRGVTLAPGEPIQYIITSANSARPAERAKALEFFLPSDRYDAEKYADLLLRAMETILQPLGLARQHIERRALIEFTQLGLWQIRARPRTPASAATAARSEPLRRDSDYSQTETSFQRTRSMS
jgi:DNA polymerase-2